MYCAPNALVVLVTAVKLALVLAGKLPIGVAKEEANCDEVIELDKEVSKRLTSVAVEPVVPELALNGPSSPLILTCLIQ